MPVETADAGVLGLLKPHSGKAVLSVCPSWQSYFNKTLSNFSNLTSVLDYIISSCKEADHGIPKS